MRSTRYLVLSSCLVVLAALTGCKRDQACEVGREAYWDVAEIERQINFVLTQPSHAKAVCPWLAQMKPRLASYADYFRKLDPKICPRRTIRYKGNCQHEGQFSFLACMPREKEVRCKDPEMRLMSEKMEAFANGMDDLSFLVTYSCERPESPSRWQIARSKIAKAIEANGMPLFTNFCPKQVLSMQTVTWSADDLHISQRPVKTPIVGENAQASAPAVGQVGQAAF